MFWQKFTAMFELNSTRVDIGKINLGFLYSWERYLCRCCRLLLVIVVSIPVPVLAASDTASIAASIVVTITLTNRSDMAFGDISSSNTPGTVVLSPGGSRETSGGANINSTVASGAAVFDVGGLSNSTYSITLPETVVLNEAGGDNMVVDNFASIPNATGLTNAGGQQSLFIGATLNVGGNQAFGSYTGTMSVTIGYN